MNRRRFLGAAAGLAVAGSAGCVGVQAVSRTETREFNVPGDAAVTVRNPMGAVTAERADVDALRVRAEKEDGVGNEDALDNVAVTGEGRADGFEVAVVDRRDPRFTDATTVDLALAVPDGVEVTGVVADDGDTTVAGVGDDLALRADDGDVGVRERGGDVTVNGDDGRVSAAAIDGALSVDVDDATVEIDDVDGDVSVDADDGAVTVTGVGGDVDVAANDGDVDVSDVEGFVALDYEDGAVSATDVGGVDAVDGQDGDLTLDIPAVRDDATVSLDDGTVTARLGEDLDARLIVETDNGRIDTAGLDGTLGIEGDVERIDATLGDAGHDLRIVTDDGDVELQSL